MSPQLPGEATVAAHRPASTSVPDAPTRSRETLLIARATARAAWQAEPTVRLYYRPDADALVVDLLPAPTVTDRVVVSLLAIALDGDDPHALPSGLCLAEFTAQRASAAARIARALLGERVWEAATAMAAEGRDYDEVRLSDAERDERLQAWRPVCFGVAIEPDQLSVAVVTRDGQVLQQRQCCPTDTQPEAVVEAISRLVTDIAAERDPALAGLPVALGVQIAGPVDAEKGVVRYFNKRTRSGGRGWEWKDVGLGEMLQRATCLPTRVLNDVSALATYERWLDPHESHSCYGVVLIAQGIGAKIVRHGEVVEWLPMEIGNMVVRPGGQVCDCGARGCVEATAGTLAILERIQDLTGFELASVQEAVEIAESGGGDVDVKVLEVFREAGEDLAKGIGQAQVSADPTLWVVYGPGALLTEGRPASDAFLKRLVEFDECVSYQAMRGARLVRRPLDGSEGVEGAAFAAVERAGLAGSRHKAVNRDIRNGPSRGGDQ